MNFNNIRIPFQSSLKYRYTDRVAGEVVQNFQLLPRATTQLVEKVILFQDQQPKKVRVQVKAHAGNFKGTVQLKTPSSWEVQPEVQQVHIEQAGASKEFIFEVRPPKGSSKASFSSIVKEGDTNYQMYLKEIDILILKNNFY